MECVFVLKKNNNKKKHWSVTDLELVSACEIQERLVCFAGGVTQRPFTTTTLPVNSGWEQKWAWFSLQEEMLL